MGLEWGGVGWGELGVCCEVEWSFNDVTNEHLVFCASKLTS